MLVARYFLYINGYLLDSYLYCKEIIFQMTTTWQYISVSLISSMQVIGSKSIAIFINQPSNLPMKAMQSSFQYFAPADDAN